MREGGKLLVQRLSPLVGYLVVPVIEYLFKMALLRQFPQQPLDRAVGEWDSIIIGTFHISTHDCRGQGEAMIGHKCEYEFLTFSLAHCNYIPAPVTYRFWSFQTVIISGHLELYSSVWHYIVPSFIGITSQTTFYGSVCGSYRSRFGENELRRQARTLHAALGREDP